MDITAVTLAACHPTSVLHIDASEVVSHFKAELAATSLGKELDTDIRGTLQRTKAAVTDLAATVCRISVSTAKPIADVLLSFGACDQWTDRRKHACLCHALWRLT